MEKIKQETKQTIINVVLKILVVLSFSWPIWFNAQALFNTLPFMQEGQALLNMLSEASQKVMFMVVTPILSSLIVFGLFVLVENMATNGIDRNLNAFGKTIDRVWHKRAMDITAICIAVFKGILETILLFNPLASNIARPLVNLFIKVIFIGLFYLAVAKKDTKEMFPFVYTSLMFPTILVVLFV